MFDFRGKSKNTCPMLNKPCIEHDCKLYVLVQGKDPQSERILDEWNCSFAWIPMLIIEGAQQTRQAGAAIESMRNEIVKRMGPPQVNHVGIEDEEPTLQVLPSSQGS